MLLQKSRVGGSWWLFELLGRPLQAHVIQAHVIQAHVIQAHVIQAPVIQGA